MHSIHILYSFASRFFISFCIAATKLSGFSGWAKMPDLVDEIIFSCSPRLLATIGIPAAMYSKILVGIALSCFETRKFGHNPIVALFNKLQSHRILPAVLFLLSLLSVLT